MNDEQIAYIKNFGAMAYDSSRMAIILKMDEDFIIKEMNNVKSEFYKAYEEGRLLNEYLIDLRLIEMAQSGDLKAISTLEIRKKTRK